MHNNQMPRIVMTIEYCTLILFFLIMTFFIRHSTLIFENDIDRKIHASLFLIGAFVFMGYNYN